MYKFIIPFILLFNIIGSAMPFLIGQWSIKGSKAILTIKEQKITINEGSAQLSMIPQVINKVPLKIHLNSLKVEKYPKILFDHKIFSAIKWVRTINTYGIYIEFDKIHHDILEVKWRIDEHTGECILEKYLN
jgi:ATP-dependent protease HslVU (ClpYQ) ATPase subunit